MTIISFVVDGQALYYYQAELLLFSLQHFAQHPKENIIVHCTTKVADCFLNFLKNNQYHYRIIEPFLDGKYCNKIRQLESFYQLEQGHLILLDTDMFALSAFTLPDENKFLAKIVDDENPPLAVIQRIFQQAALPLPDIVTADWDLAHALTIANNFNGGFYYIPQPYIKVIAAAWRKWAIWLFARAELFENERQAMHIDQISMALALCDSQIPYQTIAANYNYAIHYPWAQKSFIAENPVVLLHYHQELNHFGLLKSDQIHHPVIKTAIAQANQSIASDHHFEFYAAYRKSLIPPLNHCNNSAALRALLNVFKTRQGQAFTLILHAGTPKTGTTSLQFFLAQHNTELKNQGYLYPTNYSDTYEPKHQWLVSALLANNNALIIAEFTKILAQLEANTHSIILSTEGIYNHWFDFSQEAKSLLHIIAEYFDLRLYLWLRNPLDFANSLYCQYLKNPKIATITCYGQDWSVAEMLDNPWFSVHLDYLGFIYEIEALLGKDKLLLFSYEGNSIRQFCNTLGLIIDSVQNNKENTRWGHSTIALLRLINKHELTADEKSKIIAHLNAIDSILAGHQRPFSMDESSQQLILARCALELAVLAVDYRLDL